MDGEITIQPPLTLRGFCETVFLRHSRNWPPDESVIANEFVRFFQLDTFVTLDRLQQVCETLGMKVRTQELPKGVRGFNHVYADQREIVLGNVGAHAAALGSREHTLLHEIREQIEYEFRRTGHPVANDSDKEVRAENFASSVRLFASAIGMTDIFKDVIVEAKSGWALFGYFVLLIIAFLFSGLACFALPHWEDQL